MPTKYLAKTKFGSEDTYYSEIKFNQLSLYHRVNPPTRLVHDRTSEPSLQSAI